MRKFHRALALFSVFIAWWLLCGCALLWQGYLQRPSFAKASNLPALSRMLEVAQSRYPEPGSFKLKLPRNPGEGIQALYLSDELLDETAKPVVFWIDPETTAVLAEPQTPFWQTLYRFHSSLLLEGGGRAAVLACGLGLVGIVASGGLLWRRRTRLPRARALHRLAGIAILPLLLLSLTSGLLLSLPGRWLTAQEPEPIVLPLPLGKSPTADEIARRITELFPGLYLRELATPQTEDDLWELAWHRPGALDVEPGWVRVWVDAQHSQVRVQEPSAAWRARLRQWAYAIHTGQIAGLAGQVALTAGGLGFALQVATGLKLWLRHRKALPLSGLRKTGNKMHGVPTR